MADIGFTIYNRFYPFVRFEDWLMRDFVLARKMTGISTDDLLSRNVDSMLLQQVLVAVAVLHGNQALNMDQTIDLIWSLKPSEIAEVGFEFVEGDASPPDEAAEPALNGSSEISVDVGGATPETAPPSSSGAPGSDTGSPESPPE